MKLSIFEKNTIDETEVVVNCKQKNHEIEKLAKHILFMMEVFDAGKVIENTT